MAKKNAGIMQEVWAMMGGKGGNACGTIYGKRWMSGQVGSETRAADGAECRPCRGLGRVQKARQ